MLDKLRNQERLSPAEEYRIEKWIRIGILAGMAVALGVIVWAVIQKKTFGTGYYAAILSLLAAVWFLKYVLAAILKHSLAQRTDEQVNAYLKAAGLELVAYAGLGWFLVAMTGNAIIGAVIYMFGVMAARKQRDIYEGGSDEEEADDDAAASPSDASASAPGPRGSEDNSTNRGMSGLPSAADRQERERESAGVSEREPEQTQEQEQQSAQVPENASEHLPETERKIVPEEESADGSV